MKHTLIASLLCLALTPVSASAFEISPLSILRDSMESATETIITLTPGSETININGADAAAEPAHITDTGVTLVPLRTVSEAFGAQVEWDAGAQQITIIYSEVTIVLTIGSKAADVNGHAEELEEAPSISNETTMVPLRFIAETFGAEVSFDEATQLITITLSPDAESETLKGMHDKPYIGDSHYGWSMETPSSMRMSYRSFDGSSIEFSDDVFSIAVDVIKLDEPADPVFEYQTLIGSVKDYIVSAADMTTENDGSSKIHIRFKSSYSINDTIAIIKDSTIYIASLSQYVYSSEDMDNKAFEDMYAILSTFRNSVRDNMYDFSDVFEGMREYSDEELGISLKIPESFVSTYSSSDNKLSFISENNDLYQLSIEIYSSTPECNLYTLPDEQHEIYSGYYNPELTTTGEIYDTMINGSPARAFRVQIGDEYDKSILTKAFFETGGYIYIVSLIYGTEADCDKLLESIETEEPDPDKWGNVIYMNSLMDSFTEKTDSYSFTMPRYWYYDYFIYTNAYTGSEIYTEILSDKSDIDELQDEIMHDDDIKIIDDSGWQETDNGEEYTLTIMSENEAMNSIMSVFCKESNGKYCVIALMCPELYYSEATLREFRTICDSFAYIPKNNK